MDTQQMIEEIQEKIADKTRGRGCVVINKTDSRIYTLLCSEASEGRIWALRKEDSNPYTIFSDDIETLGHPVSLSRVLSKLEKQCFMDGMIYSTDGNEEVMTDVCKRKLLKEDGSDAYLQDQSDETIQELHTLVVR